MASSTLTSTTSLAFEPGSSAIKRERSEPYDVRDNSKSQPAPGPKPHASLTDSRLGTAASSLLITHVNKLELEDELVSLNEYVLTDIAHAVMLTRAGTFTAEHGGSIVKALLDLHSSDKFALLKPDPIVGTLGLQIEKYLESVLGPKGRDIQRGRSRIDQKATNWRLINRLYLTDVLEELRRLEAAILDTAKRYAGALMPGYTHLQHSQPTTIDHYLNAHYWALSRNFGRLLDAYDRLNVCPLGGAAYSGTSWPMNRQETAAYLGFDGPVANARDAGMASLDMGAELASVLASTLSAISRLASDLNYWASSEVGLVRIDASLCGTSSMLPQKRNPMVLERIRGLAGVSVGWAASQLGVMHTATSTDVDQTYVHNLLPSQCAETQGAIALMREVIATVEFDIPAMRISAGQHWSTASALADTLVMSNGLSFRDAHESVAQLVASHERAGGGGMDLEGGVIVNSGSAALNSLPASDIKAALDPEMFVASRTSQGGTAASAREDLERMALSDLAEQRQKLSRRTEHVAEGLNQLLQHAQDLTFGI